MATVTPTLYVLPGSHPCAAVEAAMRLKGIEFKRVDLLPASQLLLGPLLYGGRTVPGLRIGSERVVGSRSLMRRLDLLEPDPPLLPPPGDPLYARVLEAERWGDEVLQSVPRRVIDVAFLKNPAAMESYGAEANLPLPTAMLRPALPMTAKLLARINKATDATAQADLGGLPRQLERIEGWIAEGVLGGELPNAADLQIGSSLRLLASISDLRPIVQASPAGALTRYFPPMVGEVPPGAFPASWLARAARA